MHHGEYKVVGGKLVVVDLDTADGVITDVSLNGDFFLEPDDALEDLNDALRGLPIANASTQHHSRCSQSEPARGCGDVRLRR